MPGAVSLSKDAAKVRAGQIGSARRWGDPANRRVVRLDDLSVPQRAVVLALVDAAKASRKAVDDDAA
jgi:hypothetical protein